MHGSIGVSKLLSLDEVCNLETKLRNGEYGSWDEMKISKGRQTNHLHHIPPAVLGNIPLPVECVSVGVSASLVKSSHQGNYADSVGRMLKTFSLESSVRADFHMVILDREAGYNCQVKVRLPSGNNEGEILLSLENLPFKYKQEITTWFGVEDHAELGAAGLRFHELDSFPGKVSYPSGKENSTEVSIVADDFLKMTENLGEKFVASMVFDNSFSVLFEAFTGYYDVDEVIDPSLIQPLYQELAREVDVDGFDVSSGSLFLSDWETRKQLQSSLVGDECQYEQLGALAAGDDTVTLGLTYGVKGYQFYIERLESIEEEIPALAAMCEEYEFAL